MRSSSGAVRRERHGVVWLLQVAGWRTWCVGVPSSLWSSLLLSGERSRCASCSCYKHPHDRTADSVLDRVLQFPVVPQRRVRTMQTVVKPEILQRSSWDGCWRARHYATRIRRDFAVLDKAVCMPVVCRYCGGSAVTVHRQVWFTCLQLCNDWCRWSRQCSLVLRRGQLIFSMISSGYFLGPCTQVQGGEGGSCPLGHHSHDQLHVGTSLDRHAVSLSHLHHHHHHHHPRVPPLADLFGVCVLPETDTLAPGSGCFSIVRIAGSTLDAVHSFVVGGFWLLRWASDREVDSRTDQVNARGDSTGAVLGQGVMPVVILSDAFGQTVQ